jgi:hypothetical protein
VVTLSSVRVSRKPFPGYYVVSKNSLAKSLCSP